MVHAGIEDSTTTYKYIYDDNSSNSKFDVNEKS
jgi:hypothetical protein